MTNRISQQLGSYRLLQLLGKGGFAEVYLGEHIYLKTQVAIKLLHASLNTEEWELFQGEARTVARLAHPHIVKVMDFAIQDDTPYLVMEYAPGGTMRARHPKGIQLSFASIVTYVRQVAEALDYAHHQRLIHRDVKPENMLLNARDEVLLSDFGIATLSHSSRSQSTEQVVGTAAYMAPEQFLGKPRPASDQYALGIVVYEWLAGSRPFQGTFLEISGQHLHALPPPLGTQRPDLSFETEAVILRALAKDPRDRFPNVLAFADALEMSSSASTEPTIPAIASSAAPLEAAQQAITRLSTPPAPVEDTALAPTINPAWQDKPPAPSAPRRPRRKQNRRSLLSVLLSAFVLALVSFGLLFGYWLPTQRAQQSLAATHTATSQNALTQVAGTASAQSGATATVEQATTIAQNATATAQQIPPTLPYSVQVPGPCGSSNAAWSNSDTGGQLDCQADKLTLKGGSQGTEIITFTLPRFPQNFIASLDVSHLNGPSTTSVYLEINGKQQGYFFSIQLGSDNTLFTESGNGTTGGGPETYANASRTNTIAISIRGSTGSFLLNGSIIYEANLPQPLTTDNITIGLAGKAGDQVDLQNFKLTLI
ncbi:MAG TPA: serine/threonine-protein kinase [Ktedonobacterales bacterium]|nr:serine/threonine-protein kinase [Ktedonobacterales bacterium]